MSKNVAKTPEQKLRALYDLQIIDSRIDQIRIIRGELPLEVQDLEDEVLGLETRVNKIDADIKAFEDEISKKKNAIEEAKALVKKYTEQQNNVRNNREFDSLTKEIEYQDLEIQLCEKKIKETEFLMQAKLDMVDSSKAKLADVKEELEIKKNELEGIIGETRKEEDVLLKESENMGEKIDERLLVAYKRIRKASRNGLAVVPIDREASAGSFIKIPPQRQLDVAARKKIIVDEHSGRILVDKELAEEEQAKIEKLLGKVLK